MIAAITGTVEHIGDYVVTIKAGALSYEVLVPASVLQRAKENQDSNGEIRLITYHYLQVAPSSAVPILIGFCNTIERDFFLDFISVSGIGPRAAVKALNKSISEIAQAIDRGDTAYLKTLPGIGLQRAKEVVAKLQGKMGKYLLIRDANVETKAIAIHDDLREEALVVLGQLQYSRVEASSMIDKALKNNATITSVEGLLNEIYKQRIKP